ncbi:hypothetical protein BS78_04G269600 [Paspalum vaginatum]|nr:hypothetical protein BS78_04G269600 [Paspalum vaginatum]
MAPSSSTPSAARSTLTPSHTRRCPSSSASGGMPTWSNCSRRASAPAATYPFPTPTPSTASPATSSTPPAPRTAPSGCSWSTARHAWSASSTRGSPTTCSSPLVGTASRWSAPMAATLSHSPPTTS